ncbi:MAG: hypothetical protein LUQ11_01905, partial [Methylococcaceae bacterium]|nr:hypothetical protein [Methylococcaceae bacterium]
VAHLDFLGYLIALFNSMFSIKDGSEKQSTNKTVNIDMFFEKIHMPYGDNCIEKFDEIPATGFRILREQAGC